MGFCSRLLGQYRRFRLAIRMPLRLASRFGFLAMGSSSPCNQRSTPALVLT